MIPFTRWTATLPDRQITEHQPWDARRLIAAVLAKEPSFPAGLFHFGADGHPQAELSSVRFFSGTGSVGIEGFGAAAQLVDQHHRRIARLLGSTTQACERGRVEIVPTLQPVRYRIALLVPAVRGSAGLQFRALLDAPAEELQAAAAPLLAEVIGRGIRRQSDLLGLWTPVAPIEVTGIGGTRVVRRAGPAFVPALLDIEFQAPLQLLGPWSVGHLVARGFGRIVPQAEQGAPHEPNYMEAGHGAAA